MAVKNCFIRGSVVRYVQLPASAMDTQLLEDATRRGAGVFFYCSCAFLTFSLDRGRKYEQEVNIFPDFPVLHRVNHCSNPKQLTVSQYPKQVSNQ